MGRKKRASRSKKKSQRLDEEEVEVSDGEEGKLFKVMEIRAKQLNEDDMEVANLGILLCPETQQDIPLVLSSPRRAPHSIAPHHTAACARVLPQKHKSHSSFSSKHITERESEQKWKKIDAENNHKRNQEQRDHMLM